MYHPFRRVVPRGHTSGNLIGETLGFRAALRVVLRRPSTQFYGDGAAALPHRCGPRARWQFVLSASISAVINAILVCLLSFWTERDVANDRSPRWLQADIAARSLDPVRLDASVVESASDAALAEWTGEEVPAAIAPPAVCLIAPTLAGATLRRHGPARAFSGRSGPARARLLADGGGTAESEKAVAAGLAWLARRQLKSGGWSLKFPFSDGAQVEDAPAAATGMALLAFAGAGTTHRDGPHADAAARGLDDLLRRQGGDGAFCTLRTGSYGYFYTQAICCMAVCELYGMTADEALRTPSQRAVDFCAERQSPGGGWRYGEGTDSDTSVTGWVVLALRGARSAGLDVRDTVFENASRYLDSVATEEEGYRYLLGEPPTRSMTAESLLARRCLGWSRNDHRLVAAVDRFLAGPPVYGQRDVYCWYYATQLLHSLGGRRWTDWNEPIREILIKHQETAGADAGSWHPFRPTEDAWGRYGGRLYTTCLSIYILQVYYRYLPIDREPGEVG